MQWIALTINQRHPSSSKASSAALIHTKKHFVAAGGNYKYFHTATAHIFVVGFIQNSWLDSEDCLAELTRFDEEFCYVKKLNGCFSVIVISKEKEAVRIIANRSGGLRLYFHECPNQISISTSLIDLTNRLTAPKLDLISLKEELEYRWLTGERSLVADIRQLPPGSYCDLAFTESYESKVQYYWKFPASKKLKLPVGGHVENVFKNLADSINDLIRPNASLAVLLSGGVDSSLLAGILKYLGYNFVAFSHKSSRHKNPELDYAMNFAKVLNVEHRIIEINDEDIPEVFGRTTEIVEQAPRFQSSLIIYKLFESMSGEFGQVIYGEGADTLYGSNLVKRYAKKLEKREVLRKILFNSNSLLILASHVLPSKKLRMLSELTPAGHISAEHKLFHSTFAKKWINEVCPTKGNVCEILTDLVDIQDPNISKNDLEVVQLKAMNMRSSIVNHMHETGALANYFDVELLSPFLSFEMVDYASKLDDASYFGNGFVKPVLRKVGETFYPKELMYLPKIGFPAPHVAWMKSELRPAWLQAREEFQIDDNQIFDIEFMWTLSSLRLLFQKLNLELI